MKMAKYFFTLFLFFFSATVRADAIELYGFSETEAEEVKRRYPQLFKKGPLDLSTADYLIRHLMKSGNYQTIELHRNESGQHTLTVSTVKKIGKVFFVGNQNVELKELSKLITVSSGNRFNQPLFIDFAKEIKKTYSLRGFKNSSVEVSVINSTNNYVDIYFKINEGPPTILSQIVIESANKDLVKKLNEKCKNFIGKTFGENSQNEVQAAINSYLADNRYLRTTFKEVKSQLSAKELKASLIFKIENPYRYEFLITEDSHDEFSAQYLIRKIVSSTFSSSTKDAKVFTSDLIKQEYLNKGYALAEVNVTERLKVESFRRDLLIEIKEGEPVKLVDIHITGLFTRPENYYVDFILEHSSPLIQKNLYNASDLKKGLDNLNTHLKNQGFLKAKAQLTEEIFDNSEQEVRAVINLTEGPLTQIRNIHFSGNKNYSDQVLLDILQIKRNSALRSNELKEKIKNLVDFYKNNGFLEMQIKTPNEKLISFNQEFTEAAISFDIYEGPKIFVDSILVKGNKKTKTKVILRELEINRGDLLTPEKILSSQKRLFRLGIFSEVKIDTFEKNTQIKKRTVIVRLKEGKPKTLRFGAGVSNERNLTVRGYIAASHNNLFGTARVLSARAEVNSNIGDINFLERNINVSYLERFFVWPRTSLRLSTANLTNVIEVSGDEVTVSEETNFVSQLEKPLTDHTTVFFHLYDLSLQRTFEKDDKFDPEKSIIAQLGPAVTFDFRDNIFTPQKGSFTRLSLSYADPLLGSSDGIQFIKTTARTSLYWPIFSKVVWVNAFRAGYINSLSNEDDSGIPVVFEGFFLGGRPTIRGFHPINERIPSKTELGVDDLKDFKISGESHFGLFKTEIRFPLFSSVGGSIFYDGGLVKVSGLNFDDAYRDSVGFGINISTPVGPVNFEIGFKLDRKKSLGEDPLRFHFSIGSF